MPTGYTHTLVEKEQSFEDFALHCARAFGACIMQKEDNLDELPKLQEPSDYHARELMSAKKDLEDAKNLSLEEAERIAKESYEKRKKDCLKYIEERKIVRERLENMLAKVKEYIPPSEDHENYKQFMVDQLTETIKFDGSSDYWERELAEMKVQSGQEYKDLMIEMAEDDIKYYEKRWKEEVKRTEERNSWIKKLYDSLGVDYETK